MGPEGREASNNLGSPCIIPLEAVQEGSNIEIGTDLGLELKPTILYPQGIYLALARIYVDESFPLGSAPIFCCSDANLEPGILRTDSSVGGHSLQLGPERIRQQEGWFRAGYCAGR